MALVIVTEALFQDLGRSVTVGAEALGAETAHELCTKDGCSAIGTELWFRAGRRDVVLQVGHMSLALARFCIFQFRSQEWLGLMGNVCQDIRRVVALENSFILESRSNIVHVRAVGQTPVERPGWRHGRFFFLELDELMGVLRCDG